ncbi:MAG: hypothetical protein ACOYPR_08290 [Saprospiraceae bacterium]
MKKIFLILGLLCLSGVAHLYAQPPRKTLWVGGPPLTSPRWSNAITQAQLDYKFDRVSTVTYYNDAFANDIPTWAQQFNAQMTSAGQTDVLGIGHDAGGLILQYMAQLQSSNGLSALILDGVPNQGAKVFEKLTPFGSGVPSEAQNVLTSALNYRTLAQNCVACRTIEATQSYINYFAAQPAKTYYQQMIPGTSLFANLQTPTIPYAVIWGNENDDALGLTRLMSSWYNFGIDGKDSEYLDCMGKELEQRLISAKQNFAISTLRAIATLAGGTAKIKATEPQSAFALIEATLNSIATALRGSYDLNNEFREILECEFVHQALNAKWTQMNFTYGTVTETITIPVPCGFASCDDCWTQYASDHEDQVLGYCLSVCVNEECNNTFSQNVTYLVPEPNDALYTKTEQSLAGAAKTYEAKGCNHMQESFWSYDPIKDAFTDLFFGGGGAAFVVPKN